MKKEIILTLDEPSLTYIIKHGVVIHQSTLTGRHDVHFNKIDIRQLIKNRTYLREMDDAIIKYNIADYLKNDTIKEILKRSPVYSDLALEF